MSISKITYQTASGDINEIPVGLYSPHEESAMDFANRTICALKGLHLKPGVSFEKTLEENGITNVQTH
jgi:hypothetical protein